MDFDKYLKKKRSELFIFIKNNSLAVLRFRDRTEIVDIGTGEVLTTLKVKAISEAVYCGKYDKLFLKSIDNGYLYGYDFNSKELTRILKLSAHYDKGIFLSHDGEKLIGYTGDGIVYELNADSYEYRIIYKIDLRCFFQSGWDNYNASCYEFFYSFVDVWPSVIRLSYEGEFLSSEKVMLDDIPLQLSSIDYNGERDLYVMQGNKNYLMAGQEPSDDMDKLTVISKGNINNTQAVFADKYGGGCSYATFYKSALFYNSGNENIHIIDLTTLKETKKYDLNKNMTVMQYEPKSNKLYISTWSSCTIIEDALYTKGRRQ